MATRKRPGLKYKWSNGSWHTRPEKKAPAAKPAPKPAAKAPAQPPPGQYDPQLDAALAAAKRGYADMAADFTRDFGAGGTGGRAGNDYRLALQQIALGRTRMTQDRDNALGNVRLNYQRLATSQAQQDRLANVQSAGLLGQQRAIRAANQGRDEAPINLAFARGSEDFDQSQGNLGLRYRRSLEDAQLGLSRAGRETGQFGLDTAQSRLYQATQAGWRPPKPPRRRRVSMAAFGGGPSYPSGSTLSAF